MRFSGPCLSPAITRRGNSVVRAAVESAARGRRDHRPARASYVFLYSP